MLRILAAVLEFLPASTFAGSRNTPPCKDGALPFTATTANQPTGAQLRPAVSGKRLGDVRESNRTPGVGVNNMRELRPYGSMENRRAGARDDGVWSIKNDVLCSVQAAFSQRSEDCFTIHGRAAIFAARRVSGSRSACLQGTISLQ